jgi:predicted phosphate transport protein (TIGR00153 family)
MWIDRMVRWLLPRQDLFFTLLEGVAAKVTAASTVFCELATAEGHERLAGVSARLATLEDEADELCRQLYEELDRTFVTPIDREDLAHLTGALDDVVDAMEHAAAFATLFRFDSLSAPMRQLVGIAGKAAGELERAVGCLRRGLAPESIRDAGVAVHALENQGDEIYRAAVEALFRDGVEARDLVRQKDMLDWLEDGIDRCQDAMDVIRSVVVKNG